MKAILIFLVSLCSFSASNIQVSPSLETDPVSSSGDAADDTTVWIHPSQPENSIIVGTNKKLGLVLYSLDGKKLSEVSVGPINNIDSRVGFLTAEGPLQLMAGSNRQKRAIDFYTIDPVQASLKVVASLPLGYEPYGVCVGYLPSGDQQALSVIVTTKGGVIDHWEVSGREGFQFEHVQKIKVRSAVEGCSVNDETGDLFVGEEDVGLWRIQLANGNIQTLIDTVKSSGGNLVKDVEGVTIYKRPGAVGYILVSSQGDDSYHVYDLKDFFHRGQFKIAKSGKVDGVTGTDGIDVISLGLNARFPNGFFVAQDDVNEASFLRDNQNFKVVDWNEIKMKMRQIDPSFDQ